MLKITKWLIWLYLLLLLFEGALRKWVFPGIADVLLVVRDPVLLCIYMGALATGRVPRNLFLGLIGILALGSILFSFLGGQTNVIVLAYGLRTNYLHFPLIWVMAEILDREDVEKMGTCIILYGLASSLLMVQQFRSSADAKINWGVGGDHGGQIHGAGGRIRPPGFFSFAIGPTVFIPVLTAFVLYQAAGKRRIWWPLLVASGIGLAIALPVSISRGTMIASGLVGGVFVLSLLRLGLLNMALVRTAVLATAVLIALSFTPVFEDARHAFMDRWTIAANESGGKGWGSLIARVTSVVEVPLFYFSEAPFFGHGVGYGSSVAAKLLTGQRGFLLAEDEWSKCYLELGPLLGTAFLGFRIIVGLYLLRIALRALQADKDILPLMLWAAVAPTSLIFFQWAQPTVLGFAVLGGGLILASVNPAAEEDEEDEEDEEEEDDEDSDDAEDDEEEDDDGEDEDDEDDEDSDDASTTRRPTELELQRRRMRGL